MFSTDVRMNPYWSPLVSRLQPYTPGEQPQLEDFIKLNTNENPLPPSPRVLAAITAELHREGTEVGALRLYPDPQSLALKAALAQRFDLNVDQVFVGNGSDEVLALSFPALLLRDAGAPPLLVPDISYSFYTTYCRLYDVDYRSVPLAEDFSLCVEDYRQPARSVIFANPNAPTGLLLSLDQIRRLLEMKPTRLVVVDEAYIDFAGEAECTDALSAASCAPLVREYPNLLVVQTFSKGRSLAGLRVGYALGDASLIEAMERVKNSFNSYPLDRLAQVGALASLEDDAHYQAVRQTQIQTREQLASGLRALGFEVLPSSANFVFARHPACDAAKLFSGLRERRILVRHFQTERIARFLRISVGTSTQCTLLCEALAELIKN